jgi:hypothetical protein
MSFALSSNKRNGVHQPDAHEDVQHAVPPSGGGHGFLIFSALMHIAAVVVLMHAWSGGLPRAKAETATATSGQPQPLTPRLSIDVGPVQYCEMDIEKIVSRPRVESVR